jgi:hypothetical protein
VSPDTQVIVGGFAVLLSIVNLGLKVRYLTQRLRARREKTLVAK